MTITDKSPALSGQHKNTHTGNEPVIKGVNSRVIVERDAAYAAGNLRALLAMMSEQQLLVFRQWCLRVALNQMQRPAAVPPQLSKPYFQIAEARLALRHFPDTLEEQFEALEAAGLLALWAATALHRPDAASWSARALVSMDDWDVVWVTEAEGGPAIAAIATTDQQTAQRAQLRAAYVILLYGTRQ